jgi:AraC-like DNA-binding protein
LPARRPAFSTPVYGVNVPGVASHANPVTCVVKARHGSLAVIGKEHSVVGEIVIIRPGIDHRIDCGEGGFTAMFLTGARWLSLHPLAERVDGRLGDLALAGMQLDRDAQQEVRERLDHGHVPLPKRMSAVLADLAADPMARMSQAELSRRLELERTQALRLFKASTGTTFRRFKRWTGLQHAARLIVRGTLVRTAAMDAGFADTAHLTRTFRQDFGLTPSQALAGSPTIGDT